MSQLPSTTSQSSSQRSGFSLHSVGALADLRTTYSQPAFGARDTAGFSIGKTFVGDALQSRSLEASVHRMLPGQGMPFLHRHRRNEELYFVIHGRGRFLLDGHEVAVREGDFLRVAPAVQRTWSAAPDAELVYLCVQVDEGSLKQKTETDAELGAPVKW